MTYEIDPIAPLPDNVPTLPRVFLREPGWQIGIKIGSERMFCYVLAPGEDHYHRLMDGELIVFHGDEKLCLPCASRRGLLVFSPKPLRETPVDLTRDPEDGESEYEIFFNA